MKMVCDPNAHDYEDCPNKRVHIIWTANYVALLFANKMLSRTTGSEEKKMYLEIQNKATVKFKAWGWAPRKK